MIPECLYMDLSPIFIPCPFYSFFTHLTPEYDPWHTLSHNGLLASFPSPNFFPASKTMLMPLLSLECFPFPPVKSNASLMLNCQLHSAQPSQDDSFTLSILFQNYLGICLMFLDQLYALEWLASCHIHFCILSVRGVNI